MARELARAQRAGSGLAVLVTDLNDFKVINDRLGHGAGDIVLKAVAQCLLRNLRPQDICGRHGGDEFVVVLSGAASEIADLKSVELAEAVDSLTVEVGGREAIRVSVSIGAAVYPADGVTFDDLFAAADARITRTSSACVASTNLVIWPSKSYLVIV